LDLLAQSVAFTVDFCRPLNAAQLHFAHIVRSAIEWRVNIDQLHLTAKSVGKEMSKHFFIVSMEQESAVRILFWPIEPAFDYVQADPIARREGLNVLGGDVDSVPKLPKIPRKIAQPKVLIC